MFGWLSAYKVVQLETRDFREFPIKVIARLKFIACVLLYTYMYPFLSFYISLYLLKFAFGFGALRFKARKIVNVGFRCIKLHRREGNAS